MENIIQLPISRVYGEYYPVTYSQLSTENIIQLPISKVYGEYYPVTYI